LVGVRHSPRWPSSSPRWPKTQPLPLTTRWWAPRYLRHRRTSRRPCTPPARTSTMRRRPRLGRPTRRHRTARRGLEELRFPTPPPRVAASPTQPHSITWRPCLTASAGRPRHRRTARRTEGRRKVGRIKPRLHQLRPRPGRHRTLLGVLRLASRPVTPGLSSRRPMDGRRRQQAISVRSTRVADTSARIVRELENWCRRSSTPKPCP
jgi:hypothetical protein